MKTRKLMTTTLSAIQYSALVVAAMVMVSMTSVEAAVVTTAGTGAWSSTTANAPWPGGTTPATTDSIVVANGHTLTIDANTTRTNAGISITGTLTMANPSTMIVNGDVSGTGIILAGTSNGSRTLHLTGNWSFTGTSVATKLAVTCIGSGIQTISGIITTGTPGNGTVPSLTVNKTGGSVTLQNSINMPVFTLTAGTFDASTYMVTNNTCTLTGGTLKLGAATRAANLQTFATPVLTTIEYNNANPTIDGSVVYQNLTFSGSGTAGASAPLTIQGTLANTGGGTLNFGANDVTLNGAVAANNIAGFTTTGGVTVNKTSGTATLMGNVNATALTMTAGTLNLGTGLTHTLSGNWTRNAGTLNGGSSTLKIGGSVSGTGGTFTPGTGTVEWNAAGAQSIAVLAYNNLSLSGSGVKTVASGTSISGNLSIAPTGSATASLASGLNFNVDTLTLGGVGRINGTWGSTTATSATHKNDIYFDATTGYLTVTTSTAPVDSTAPTPNPMTFASAPVATSPTSISMTATTATDLNDVQYYFACTAGGGHDSVWQVSPTYEDTGLTPSTLYTYTVKARDQSPANNQTTASGEASATTTDGADSTPPTPDPMTFASAPAAIGPYSITMTATTATDSSGVEYLFTCTAGAGGHNSGWTNTTTYVDTGLTPNTLYTYTVTARDKSLNHNATVASSGASATTDALDTTAPTPNPMTWESVPAATGLFSISMTATTATDPNGVEYSFNCTGGGGHNSGWTNAATYVDTGLTPSTLYTYTVTARDKSPAQNVTSASTGESATTDADTTAPTPSPMTWASAPAATGPFSISMTATTASDLSGVEYYFTCTAGGGHDSGWTNAATYVDTGLTTNTTYTYTVTARDKSLAQNATSASAPASATTLGLAATWDGSAGDQLWLTTANWTPAYAPNNMGARALIDRQQMATPDDAILDVTGNTVTVGQIDIESTATFSVTLNGGGTGKMVFDNGGSSARWNIETIGAGKSLVTVKLGNIGYVLADDLVITSLTTVQFRPVGTLTNALGESHSVTYTGTGDYKLAWTASNTGGTIVDGGQIRSMSVSLDTRIGVATSGPDLLLKNGGRIFVGENLSHTLSRTVEIGSGGGKFISDAGDSLTFSGVISGAGDLTVSKTGIALATVDLAGTATNTLTGNVVLLNPQTGAGNELLVVADKVGAFGQTPLLTVGTNVIVRITANATSGEGAIDDDSTVVRLMSATSVFDVATGVNEKLGKHKLQRFNGITFDTIAAGIYSSSTVFWVTGGGTVTVDTGPIGTLISFF